MKGGKKGNQKRKRREEEDDEEDDMDFDAQELLALQSAEKDERKGSQAVDEEDEDKREPGPAKNNQEALKAKIAELALPSDFGWVESLDLVLPPLAEPLDHNDDLKREATFYQQSVSAVTAGINKLVSLQIPFQRPGDYFAEMIKPDAHMAKVKSSLLLEKKKMKAVEERKKQKEHKKFAKQIQAAQQQEKAKQKRENLEKISKMKKAGSQELSVTKSALDFVGMPADVKAESNDGDGGEDGSSSAQDEKQGKKRSKSKSGDEEETARPKEKKKNNKRAAKDKKYGFGGKKSNKKDNNDKSASNLGEFSLRKNRSRKGFKPAGGPQKAKGGPAGQKGKSPARGKSQPKRPGKNARKKQRTG